MSDKCLLTDGENIFDINGSVICKYDKDIIIRIINDKGFRLGEIKDFEKILGLRVITASSDIANNIKKEDIFMIIKHDFSNYDNIYFHDNHKILVSSDNLNWYAYYNESAKNNIGNSVTINSNSFEELTDDEKVDFEILKKECEDRSKELNLYDNDDIRYIFIKVNKEFNAVYEKRVSNEGYIIRIMPKSIIDEDCIRVYLDKDYSSLKVKLIKSDNTKNTLKEY